MGDDEKPGITGPYRDPKQITKIEGWLHPNPETKKDQLKKERELLDVAYFLKEKIQAATELKIKDIQSGNKIRYFFEYLQELWPDSDITPSDDPDDITPAFFFESSGLTFNGVDAIRLKCVNFSAFDPFFDTMFLNTDRLDQIDDQVEELRKRLLIVLADMFHEVEHFYFVGKNFKEKNGEVKKERLIKYFADPNEMRAYAKEYAFVYVENYPNTPFDYEKLRELLLRLDIPGAKSYFESCLNLEKQREYAPYCDMQLMHDQVTALTQKFVTDLQNYP